MKGLDYIVIIIFSCAVIATGLSFSKQGKNMKSFFGAGGLVPWPMSGLSLFMGFFSAGTFVVWGSIAYSLGWTAVTIQWTMALAGFWVGTFVAPRWRRTGVLTAAEYITKRFDVVTQKTYTYIFLFISLFTTGAFLYPVAKLLEVSSGLSLTACILLLGGLCVLYVAVGGLWAVISTDILQFVILTAAVLIVIPLSFNKVDGVMNFLEKAPDTFFQWVNGEYTWLFIIAFGIYNAIFLGGNWAYVQRYTCVKSEQDARKVGWLFGGLYLISPVLWMLPPMIYRVLNPAYTGIGTESEGAYLLMCKEALPSGMLGLMLAGMLFATASALNSILNISSGVFTNDIYKRLRPKSSNRTLMRIARLSTIGFGLLAIVVALLITRMGGIVNVVISLAALTGVPIYLPIIWSLFSSRQTKTSLLCTTFISLAINAFFKFISPAVLNFLLNRTEEMVLGVGLPFVILSLFECWYLFRKSPKFVFEKQERNLSEEEKKGSEESNRFSRNIIGISILLSGVLIIVLGIMASFGQIIGITMGGILLITGALIRYKK